LARLKTISIFRKMHCIFSHIPVMLNELTSNVIEVLWLQVHLANLKHFIWGVAIAQSANSQYLNV
jgi:hypothetical protein